MNDGQLAQQLLQRFDQIDARFDSVDARFDSVDARFDAVDARFDSVDARFDSVDARLDAMDIRFDGMDTRLDATDVRMGSMDARMDSMDARSDESDRKSDRMAAAMVNGFAEIHRRLDQTATKEDVHRIYDLLDRDMAEHQRQEEERLAMTSQLNRHERWIGNIAKDTGISLHYES